MEEDDVVGPIVEVGVAGGSDGSSFFSTLNLVLEGVLALTRRSAVEVGRGLVTIGRKGVSRSRRDALRLWVSKAGWYLAEKMVMLSSSVLFGWGVRW